MSASTLLEITQDRLDEIFGPGDADITVTDKQYKDRYSKGVTYNGFEIKKSITIKKIGL